MTGQPSKLHPVWEIADKRCDKGTTQQAVYRIRPNCFILVNTDGETLTVVVETKRKDVPLSRECFALYSDGSVGLTVWAEVKSGLTERIDTVMLKLETLTYSKEDVVQKSSVGFNRIKIQLDELAKRLGSRHLQRVNFYKREEVIPKDS